MNSNLKPFLSIATLALFLVTASVSHAECNWGEAGTVSEMQMYANTGVYKFKVGGLWHTLNSDNPEERRKVLWNFALAAYLSGKKIMGYSYTGRCNSIDVLKLVD